GLPFPNRTSEEAGSGPLPFSGWLRNRTTSSGCAGERQRRHGDKTSDLGSRGMSEPDRLIAITVAAVCLLIGLFGMLVFPDARSKWRALLTVLTSTVVALGLRTVGAGASLPAETPYLLVLLIVIAGVGCWTTGGFHRT